ncbi:hypothetical protein M5D96_006386 [Drosophila gunungcola]|uniref:Uncharacterized protein n=1 Tax=Drosophila gunungcola TaxID=103775 RepID=A0A9P9YNW4_9MUSC|nr:hypothetical protein M5D96_006386 [Drosophila gunungcola]
MESGQQFAFVGERMRWLGILTGTYISLAMATMATMATRIPTENPLNGYEIHLKQLLQRMLWAANVKKCFGVIYG